MQLDPNIILQAKQVQDPLESYGKALNLKNMAMQNQAQESEMQKKQVFSEALKSSVVDGKVDHQAVIQKLSQVDPLQAETYAKKVQSDFIEKQKQDHGALEMVWGSADPNDMRPTKLKLKNAGVTGWDEIPDVMTKEQYDKVQKGLLSTKEQFAMQKDQERLAFDKQKHSDDMNFKYTEAGRKAKGGESLPFDKKKSIETKATKNANIASIENELDAVLEKWDKMTPDQQYYAGQSLIKTMNSTQGADAVGEGEAARLAGNLEFIWSGNLFNSNPMQLGRDLPGFKNQVQNIRDKIKTVREKNQADIDSEMGRAPKQEKLKDYSPPVFDFSKAHGIDPAVADMVLKIREEKAVKVP